MAFDLGWELQVLEITHELSDEIALKERDARKLVETLWFLRCIEEYVFSKQRKERRFWVKASTTLSRLGITVDIQRLIMPGPIRYGGLPVALLPPCMIG